MLKSYLPLITVALILCLTACKSSKFDDSTSDKTPLAKPDAQSNTSNTSDHDLVPDAPVPEKLAQNKDQAPANDTESTTNTAPPIAPNHAAYLHFENENAIVDLTLQRELKYESFKVNIYETQTHASYIGVIFEPLKADISLYALDRGDESGTYIPTGKYEDLTVGADSRTLNIEYIKLVSDGSDQASCQACRIIVNEGYAEGALKNWCGNTLLIKAQESELYKKCHASATVKDITNQEYVELYDRLIGQFRDPNILG